MKHQQQPNPATCLITSVGMLFGVDTTSLIGLIGHDGMTVLWPNQPSPNCYRGHSIDEVMWLALLFGRPLRLFNRISYIGHTEEDVLQVATPYYWEDLFNRPEDKILINEKHVVAYSDSKIFDPSRYGVSQLPVKASDYEIILL